MSGNITLTAWEVPGPVSWLRLAALEQVLEYEEAAARVAEAAAGLLHHGQRCVIVRRRRLVGPREELQDGREGLVTGDAIHVVHAEASVVHRLAGYREEGGAGSEQVDRR